MHSFVIGGKTYEVEVGSWEGNRVQVKVNGKSHSIEVKSGPSFPSTPPPANGTTASSVPALPAAAPSNNTSISTGTPGQVCAPMAGQVLSIMVSEGDAVKIGDELIVLEAMKMENKIQSSIDGIVENIAVQVQQVVNRGEVMITIRSS